ncbi:hypothetical protein [Terriglobus sp. RCC_193]|uniref:hypothetical protein n=1 Tax=Terriglobus sp. RCC_193 TaxID=3239218 RepID=UPI0035256945
MTAGRHPERNEVESKDLLSFRATAMLVGSPVPLVENALITRSIAEGIEASRSFDFAQDDDLRS